jgi:hypothetical protein
VLGQSETWTTIEPVAKAIGVLERLTERIRKRRRCRSLEPGIARIFSTTRGVLSVLD